MDSPVQNWVTASRGTHGRNQKTISGQYIAKNRMMMFLIAISLLPMTRGTVHKLKMYGGDSGALRSVFELHVPPSEPGLS